ncbi:Integrin alpha-1 [Bagarius yarrelli]|uniref:Activated RNA polymerase II transcriptional coactivator p15 n=1 Tax=Bagarius yarrelli TaxID=175774 RepID=A0A556U2R3_BAGYA|nr:Integrin alpha-1 [Bagarius yarrelli]
MKFFGQSIHGIMDLNNDGIIDVTIGGIGGAALYWSRDVAELRANMSFNVDKINVQQPTCQIHGKDTVCVKTRVCFRYAVKSEKETNPETHSELKELGVVYGMCGVGGPRVGPVWGQLALVDCGNDEKCIADLHLKATPNISSLVIKAYQEKFHVSIDISNSRDNAYNTKVTLSTTENINYVKVEPKDKDCELNHTRAVCAVGYPFLKSNALENFKVLFEINPFHIRKDIIINVTATTDSEEPESAALLDNFVQISIPVKYEASLTFTAKKTMKEDHIILKEKETAPSVINDTSMIGEEMNVSYTVERDADRQSPPLRLTVTFPFMTQAENVLLYLTHLTFSAGIICAAHVNPLAIGPTNLYKRKAKAETLSDYLLSCEEKANPCRSFSCDIPSAQFNQINITFRVWKQTFIQGEFSSLFLKVHALLENMDESFFQLSKNDERREVNVQILKESRGGIPLWIIILSILIGLLILALVIFCLWKSKKGNQQVESSFYPDTVDRMPKSKEVLSSTSSSDSDSEADTKVKRKKQMTEKPAKKQKSGESSKTSSESKSGGGSSNKKDNMFQIGKMRYVSVREFKGKVLIDIREYWMDQEGEMKPGKKGISLNPEQWNQLKEQMDDIDDAVKRI